MRRTVGCREDRSAKQNLRGCTLLVRPGMSLICRRESDVGRLSVVGQCLGGIFQVQRVRNVVPICTVCRL
jgi:hypothetical protein